MAPHKSRKSRSLTGIQATLPFVLLAINGACANDDSIQLSVGETIASVIVFAFGGDEGLRIAALNVDDGPIALIDSSQVTIALLFTRTLAELQYRSAEISTADGTTGRPIHNWTTAQIRRDGATWVEETGHIDELTNMLLPRAPPVECLEAGGCFQEHDEGLACSSCTPTLIAAPRLPTPTEAPMPPVLTPCADDWVEEMRADVPVCSPPPSSLLPRMTCAADSIQPFRTSACEPLGPCANGRFPDVADGPGVYFVDPGAAPGGDGTRLQPWSSLQVAMSLISRGATVALAAAEFRETVGISEEVTLIGACASRTRIIVGAHPVNVAARARLSDLAVTSSIGLAIAVSAQAVGLARVSIAAPETALLFDSVGTLHAQRVRFDGSVVLHRGEHRVAEASLHSDSEPALRVDPEASLELNDSVFTAAPGGPAIGLLVYGRALVNRVATFGGATGIYASGGSLRLTDVDAWLAPNRLGQTPVGITAANSASVSLSRVALHGNGTRLFAAHAGTRVRAEDPWAGDAVAGEYARSIVAVEKASVWVRRAILLDHSDIAAEIDHAELRLDDTVIGELHGDGVTVHSASSLLRTTRIVLEKATTIGISATESDVGLVDTLVHGVIGVTLGVSTLLSTATLTRVQVEQGGEGFRSRGDTRLTVEDFRFRSNGEGFTLSLDGTPASSFSRVSGTGWIVFEGGDHLIEDIEMAPPDLGTDTGIDLVSAVVTVRRARLENADGISVTGESRAIIEDITTLGGSQSVHVQGSRATIQRLLADNSSATALRVSRSRSIENGSATLQDITVRGTNRAGIGLQCGNGTMDVQRFAISGQRIGIFLELHGRATFRDGSITDGEVGIISTPIVEAEQIGARITAQGISGISAEL